MNDLGDLVRLYLLSLASPYKRGILNPLLRSLSEKGIPRVEGDRIHEVIESSP